LFAHAAGVWAKKIRGKMHYFGPWLDPDGALDAYDKVKDALHAGRKPREATDSITIEDVCNCFLHVKQALVDAAELSARTWADYKQVCVLVAKHFGRNRLAEDVGPDDFAASAGAVSAGGEPRAMP
jgi:hypothetical protein